MDFKKDISCNKQEEAPDKRQGQSGASYSASAQGVGAVNSDVLANVSSFDFGVLMSKKTEKLTTALYMVTSFLSDSEPIKWKMRDRGVVLLSGIIAARNESVSEVENVFAQYSHVVEEVISLLEVAMMSKLISEMNFSILKKEYVSLKSLIDSKEYEEKRSGRFVFPENFFQNEDELSADNANTAYEEVLQIASEENRGVYKGHVSAARVPLRTGQGQKTIQTAGRSYAKPRPLKKSVKDIKVNKTNRRDAILKLFKKGRELMIKDISHKFTECSEKTIQRELIVLVSTGALKKKGERRWSKYSLK